MSNGYFIKSKPSHDCPEDYKQDRSDPMVCIPVFECDFRTSRVVDEDCCIPYDQLECGHFEKDIKIVDCVNCKSRVRGGVKLYDIQE